MSTTDQVKQAYADGFMCSQSILTVFGPRFGLRAELAGKLSCGLAGGMSWPGQTCGAVTGAVMVLGLALCEGSAADEMGPFIGREGFGDLSGLQGPAQLLPSRGQEAPSDVPEGSPVHLARVLGPQALHQVRELFPAHDGCTRRLRNIR